MHTNVSPGPSVGMDSDTGDAFPQAAARARARRKVNASSAAHEGNDDDTEGESVSPDSRSPSRVRGVSFVEHRRSSQEYAASHAHDHPHPPTDLVVPKDVAEGLTSFWKSTSDKDRPTFASIFEGMKKPAKDATPEPRGAITPPSRPSAPGSASVVNERSSVSGSPSRGSILKSRVDSPVGSDSDSRQGSPDATEAAANAKQRKATRSFRFADTANLATELKGPAERGGVGSALRPSIAAVAGGGGPGMWGNASKRGMNA